MLDQVLGTRICIIDDDDEFGRYLQQFFEARGARVTLYQAGDAFLSAADALAYDFYLVDLTLPGADGVDLVLFIRAQTEAVIIVISGRMGPDAFNAALVAGADMFINKPVRFDQVAQAMAAVKRRLGTGGGGAVRWELSFDERILRSNKGEAVELTATESHLLAALIEAGEAGCDRMTLRNIAASPDADERAIDAAVFRMRKKIEKATGRPAPIKTRHGLGYHVVPNIGLR